MGERFNKLMGGKRNVIVTFLLMTSFGMRKIKRGCIKKILNFKILKKSVFRRGVALRRKRRLFYKIKWDL